MVLIKGSRRNSDFGSVASLFKRAGAALDTQGPPSDASTFAAYFCGEWQIPPRPGWKPGKMIASLPNARSGDFIPIISRQEKSRIGVGIRHIKEQSLPPDVCLIADRHIDPGASSVAVLRVDSIQRAVEHWVYNHRRQFTGTLFAITGSVGKSTTTLMLSRMLKKRGRCLVNLYDNLRSGLYRTACMLNDQDHAVFEVAQGSLPSSALTLCPDIAILLSVSPAHMERHESLEDLVRCKVQIFEGNPGNGAAVISRDIPCYEIAEEKARTNGRNINTFGRHEQSDFRLISHDAANKKFSFMIDGNMFECAQSVPGEHISLNILAVIAAMHSAGLNWKDAMGDLQQASQPPSGRGNMIKVAVGAGTAIFLDHSYNSSPQSLQAALDMLYQWPARTGRRIAVLSDMLELGADTQRYHEQVANLLDASQLEIVILIGEHMRSVSTRLPDDLRVITLNQVSDVFRVLPPLLNVDDIVMLKGSNGTGLRSELKKYLETLKEEESATSLVAH